MTPPPTLNHVKNFDCICISDTKTNQVCGAQRIEKLHWLEKVSFCVLQCQAVIICCCNTNNLSLKTYIY